MNARALAFAFIAIACVVVVGVKLKPVPENEASSAVADMAPSGSAAQARRTDVAASQALDGRRAQASSSNGSPSGAPSKKIRMRDDFNNATGYRAFLAKAFANPGAGGLTYANYVIQVCNEFMKSGKAGGSQPQQAAAALLTARCDFSKDEAWQQMAASMASKKLTFDDDPAMGATFRYLRIAHPSSGDLKQLVSTYVDDPDPISLGNLITINSPVTGEPGERPPLYFDGHWYADGTQATLDDAWALARCQFGLNCGAESTAALELCAQRGWCGDSVHDALDAGYAGRPEELAVIKELAGRLANAIYTKNADAFVARVAYHP